MVRLQLAFLFGALGPLALADPPGAVLSQTLAVPDSLRSAPFDTEKKLAIPPGFDIALWARLPGARFLAIAPNGDVFVSQPSTGSVVVFRPDPAGGVPASSVYLSGLRQPHGLAFDRQADGIWLYVAESNRVERYLYHSGDLAAPKPQILVDGLPDGAGAGYAHQLKSVALGPDHALYVGIGSSCNACASDTTANPVRASIWHYNADGSGGQLFASGLRNPEGLAFLPGTNALWTAVNSRDELPYPFHDATGQYGTLVRAWIDNHPPDLFTAVRAGGNYGWPFCNSDPDTATGVDNMALDIDVENNGAGQVNCASMDRASKGIAAHSAPLGLTFFQATNFAGPWRQGAAIAYHGSWDRTVPTGYRVAWFPWDSQRQAPGAESDLVTGFYAIGGRPVATAALPDGSLLITDDANGAIYRLHWAPSAVSAASGYPVIAPDSYASVYGAGFPDQISDAIALNITDAAGQTAAATLVYVSATQINFLVPAGLKPGTAHLSLRTPAGVKDLGSPEIRAAAPGLFTSDGSEAAAVALDANGKQLAFPVNVNPGPVYLSLYGTGIRGAASGDITVSVNGEAVPVFYAGAQSTLPGLDQVNVQLPASLSGTGQARVQLSAGGSTANPVTIRIQ